MKSWQVNKWCHLYHPTEEPVHMKTGVEKPGQNQPITVSEIDTVHVFETCGAQRSEDKNANCSSVKVLKFFVSQEKQCLTILGSRSTKSTMDKNIMLECWKAIQLTRPFLRFPESINHISVVYSRENDEITCYQKISDRIYQMVVLIQCVGSPGSVHLMSVPQYELLTTAVCADSVTDAVWYWPLERLFVLQQNRKLGVFSTAGRPCSLLCEWTNCLEGDVTFAGPMHIYHSTYPDWLATASRTNSIVDQPMLLLLIGLSDGTLGILCPERGLLLTKTHAHQAVESNGRSFRPILWITSNHRIGRMVTTAHNGPVRVWSAMDPLPLTLDEIQFDASVHIKLTHRLRYTRFPFELVHDVQLFCLYTTPSLRKNESHWNSTERGCHVNLCLESTLHKSSPVLRSYHIETAHPLLPAYYCELTCLTKSSCVFADEESQMEQFQDLFGYKQFLFSSVLQDTGCQTTLNMKQICDIQKPSYSDDYSCHTVCGQSVRLSESFVRLQCHAHDLRELLHGRVTPVNHKTKQNLSKRERGIIKRHALENYLSGLLCNSRVIQFKMDGSNLATDKSQDEEVITLELALEKAYKEQEMLQNQSIHKHLRSKKGKNSRKNKGFERPSALRKNKEPEQEAIQEPADPFKQAGSGCGPLEIDSYNNSSMAEWNADPVYRSRGFFVYDALRQTGMWKYGWMPNSALIGTRYSGHYQTVDQNKQRQPVWRKPDLNALRLHLSVNSVDVSGRLTTDDSSGSVWFISSEDTTIDTTTRSVHDLLTERLAKPEPEPEVLDSCVEREQEYDLLPDEDPERSQTGLTHNMQKELKRLLTEGESFNLPASIKPRTIPQRSASFENVNREMTVFLTEVREDDSLRETKSTQLPEFLKPYEHTHWLSAFEQSYRNQKPAYLDPNSFVRLLVDSNFLLDVLTLQIPPCPEDETVQTTVNVCQAIGSIHVQYGLSSLILSLVHHLLITHCLKNSHVQRTTILGVTSLQGGTPPWSVLWACISLLIQLGFRDIHTVALILSAYLLMEAVCKINASYASEKQEYLLKVLDHAGLKDPQHRLQNELICLFKGRPIHESNSSSAHTKSSTALCEWIIGDGSDEFYWTKTIQIVQQWLAHWAAASETQYSEQRAQNSQSQTKISGVLSRPKATDGKRKHARKISWAESNDQVTIVEQNVDELKLCVTGIDAINAFCLLDDQEMRPLMCLRDPTQPACVQPWKAYQNALQGKFPPIVQLKLPKCALIPFGERESRLDMLWQRLVDLRKWKSQVDSLSQKQRERLLKASTEGGSFDSLLKNKKHLENYEQMLIHLILECEGRMNQFVAWFIPSLSRVLPLVSSWNFPEIEQPVVSTVTRFRKSQDNLQLHKDISDRLGIRQSYPSEMTTFEMNDVYF
ncbi:uncharacterized protein DEA37_0014976 [Paragonimus westermani]|uniref:Uncharacterized protein n=1 Tax=Paragonimus westermani TaxID=34504 RepID=A0A5J4NZS1_9TREM|nr:uncharacterized protein DEA37_0014976 [Paragonimus westermani]